MIDPEDARLEEEHLEILECIEDTIRSAYQKAMLMDIDHANMVAMIVEEYLDDGDDVTISIVNEAGAADSLIANGYHECAERLLLLAKPGVLRVVVASKTGVSLMSRDWQSLITNGDPPN